jgi:hypothetical protein
MPVRNKAGSLTAEEKPIVKSLLARKWRNQDIQDLVNRGRKATINSGRVTEVKKNGKIQPTSDQETDFFIAKKKAWDPKTGLNLFDDERLIRAREAICLAVQVFNSPSTNFKTEVFVVLANLAWTYLMHEHYVRQGVNIADANGKTVALSTLLRRNDCPLSQGIKNNLGSLKAIRDDVEHKLMGASDATWQTLFQACCLNFDKTIRDLFGEQLSLQNELGVALQFAKLNVDQIATVEQYGVPQHIAALDARLRGELDDEQLHDLEYRFRVVYTLDSASKSQAHIRFVHPGSDEGQQIRNILVKDRPADELYPHKPDKVRILVSERAGKAFTSHNHTQAWKRYKPRPASKSAHPEKTNRDYCIYHAAHKDYTYSDAWVEFLVAKVMTEDGYNEIRATKL